MFLEVLAFVIIRTAYILLLEKDEGKHHERPSRKSRPDYSGA